MLLLWKNYLPFFGVRHYFFLVCNYFLFFFFFLVSVSKVKVFLVISDLSVMLKFFMYCNCKLNTCSLECCIENGTSQLKINSSIKKWTQICRPLPYSAVPRKWHFFYQDQPVLISNFPQIYLNEKAVIVFFSRFF